MLAVLLPPGTLLCLYGVAIKSTSHFSDDPSRSAAVPVAVSTLIGTPLLWFCILRRDAVNVAQRRARANANASEAYRRSGTPRLRPSAPTVVETDFPGASGMFERIL